MSNVQANDSVSSLSYGVYDFNKYGYVMAPPPKLNGGLYGGQPFASRSYGNNPVIMDTTHIMRNTMRSAGGLSETRMHLPDHTRGGNNLTDMSGLTQYSSTLNMICVPDTEIDAPVKIKPFERRVDADYATW